MRVLVVEDEQDVCDVFADFLVEIGHQPLIARTAEDALSMLRTDRPDAMLLDIQLPGMSGLELLRIQTLREPRVPIVVISGVATESQARECLRLGAFDFMGKPVPLRRLEEVLDCLKPHAPAPAPSAHPAERRRAPRAPVEVPVRAVEYNGAEWNGTSVNLSASGVKIRSDDSVQPGPAAKLFLSLPDGGSRLEVASILVRADFDGYAFCFINVTAPQLHRLSALVDHVIGPMPSQAEPHIRILHAIAQAVSKSLDVDEVLRTALDALTHVTGHEISSLHLLSPDGATLHLQGDRGLRPDLREINRVLTVGRGLIGQVAATGKSTHVPDVSATTNLLPSAREAVEREGIRGFVCVPIQTHGRILGTLSLGRRTPELFTEAEIALVEASASQIGAALENAKLYGETRRLLDDVKHAETQLVEGERLSTVGKLAAGLVHEINNPLTTILGQAQLLMTTSQHSDKDQERLRIVIQETSRAARLLQNLLQLSRRQAPERRRCDLAEQVRFVLELKRFQIERDGIEVRTAFDPVPPVWADENQIRQVLLNLVQNAQHAMAKHAGPRVLTLSISGLADGARLDVLDTGPGIPADVLPRIFDAFFTTKPQGEGTGLGLWVSYSIIEQHDGRLQSANRPEGGAVFTVELPHAQD